VCCIGWESEGGREESEGEKREEKREGTYDSERLSHQHGTITRVMPVLGASSRFNLSRFCMKSKVTFV